MANLVPPDEGEAVAEAVIVLSEDSFETALSGGDDVLAAARIAGIMAAKKTPELIVSCYDPTPAKLDIAIEPVAAKHALRITATAKPQGRSSATAQALTAAAIAALTVIDMIKAQEAVIETIRLIAKPAARTTKPTPALRSLRKTPVSSTRGRSPERPAPAAFVGDIASPPPPAAPDAKRAAFRNFMAGRHLRATEWAKQAGVPAAQVYAFLTGRLPQLSEDVIQKLARAAQVRPEDMFR